VINIFFGGEKYCQVTAGEDKNDPKWYSFKAHFTYLGTTRAKYHGPFLCYIPVHHYSNSETISDLTYNSKTPALWSSGYCPSIWLVLRALALPLPYSLSHDTQGGFRKD